MNRSFLVLCSATSWYVYSFSDILAVLWEGHERCLSGESDGSRRVREPGGRGVRWTWDWDGKGGLTVGGDEDEVCWCGLAVSTRLGGDGHGEGVVERLITSSGKSKDKVELRIVGRSYKRGPGAVSVPGLLEWAGVGRDVSPAVCGVLYGE